jgi:hypothetical protein
MLSLAPELQISEIPEGCMKHPVYILISLYQEMVLFLQATCD